MTIFGCSVWGVVSERPRILVVDDEVKICRVLRTRLSLQGYEVKVASDGQGGLDAFKEWRPDLVIAGLAMPKMSGTELCESIREFSRVPIIVLSVRRGDANKIEALDKGADDYVTKPFSMNELLARIRAHLRRGEPDREEENGEPINIGDFEINPQTRIINVRQKEVHLTPKEYNLLVYMARHPRKVLSHRVLLSAVWGGQSVKSTEYLWVFINHLRKKIEPAGSPQYILTEPRIGYRFLPEGS